MPEGTDTIARSARIDRFLAGHGWAGAERRPLAGDASFRRYVRLTMGDARAMLMDAPPPREDVRPFARLAGRLLDLGLSAPRILARDDEAGLLLIEDFGDDTFTRLLARGANEWDLYALGVDALVHLHARPPAEVLPADLPVYDQARLLDEARLLTDWALPAARGHATPAAERGAYDDAWRAVLGPVLAAERTLVLRDFHVDNLMRLDGRPGAARCGLLDFQDAVAGPAAYDLMSLLEDARRDVPDDLQAAMKERYFAARPVIDRAAFETVYVILAAQRHAKVIGIFARLNARDGKPVYLKHIPRVWRLLDRALRHPALAPVAAWFARHVPDDQKGVPPCRM